MKKIESIIQPYKLEQVKEAIIEAGAAGLTVSEVRGFGRQKGHKELYRGAEYQVDFIPKIKIEVVVADDLVPKILAAVEAAAKSGKVGDGKIFVTNVEEAVRVRTGERGQNAL